MSESDYDATTSVSVGYSHVGPRTSFAVVYTPTLVRRVRYSKLRTFNQSMNLFFTRSLSPRWDFSVTANAMDSSFDQLMFLPAVLSVAPAPMKTLDDLLESARSGQYNSDQLASMLTGTPYVASPSRSILFGTSYLSSIVSLGLGYRPSTRLHVDFNVSASRSETRDGLQEVLPSQSSPLLPRLLSQQASMGLTYSFTPRTAAGLRAEGSHVDSVLGRYYVQSTQASFNHSLTRHWYMSLAGGPAYVMRTSQPMLSALTVAQGVRQSYSGQASAGYSSRQHSLTASYGVSPTDMSGFGSQRSDMATVSWEWQAASRPWGFNVSAGHQSMTGGVLGDIQYWQGKASLARFISPHLTAIFTYAYVGRPAMVSSVVGGSQDLAGFSGRFTLLWTPQPRGRRAQEGQEAGGAGQQATTMRTGS